MVPRKILKITYKNQYKYLFRLLFDITLMIILVLYYNFNHFVILALSLYFLVLNLPVFYLHLEYYLINKGEEYEIKDNTILQRKKGIETVIKSDDVEKITFYLSPSLFKNSNVVLLLMDEYYYAEVKLKDGSSIFLTCLLSANLRKEFTGVGNVVASKKKTFFITKISSWWD